MTLVAISAVHVDVLSALHGHGFDKSWPASAFAELLASPGMAGLIAVGDNEDPQGFVLWRGVLGEAELITLVTRQDHRRQGIAKHLVDGMIARLLEADTQALHLEVAADNLAAIAFYEHSGFTASGRRPKYYAGANGRVDAILMRLGLSQD